MWTRKQQTVPHNYSTVNDYVKVAVAIPEVIQAGSLHAPHQAQPHGKKEQIEGVVSSLYEDGVLLFWSHQDKRRYEHVAVHCKRPPLFVRGLMTYAIHDRIFNVLENAGKSVMWFY